MNTITLKRCLCSDGWENECFVIDGVPLHTHLEPWCRLNAPELLPTDTLAVTWNAVFDTEGDARFMRHLLTLDKLNLPILSCPEDLDFSCTVLVADIEKTYRCVYWKRIGRVNHAVERFAEEKQHGIVFTDGFSDADWETYRDIAFLRVDSPEWREWISWNWSEELYRRRVNYTYPCYQNERNIDWIFPCNWCFDRQAYDALVGSCCPQ